MKRLLTAAAIVLTLLLALPTAASAAAPTNDNRADATVIEELPFDDTVVVDEATLEANEPQQCGGANKSVWYRIRPDDSGTLVLTAEGNYPREVAVYEGTLAAMSFDRCRSARSVPLVTPLRVTAGHNYFFQVTCYVDCTAPVGEVLTLDFNVRWQPKVVTTVDPRVHTRTSDGRGTITGVMTCSEPVEARLTATLDQRIFDDWTTRSNTGFVTCINMVRWQIHVQQDHTGAFINGPATVALDVAIHSERINRRVVRDVKLRTCTLLGTLGADELIGTAGADRICGLAGDDLIRSGGDNDKIYSGPGEDNVGTGAGNDFTYGDEGADRINTGSGNDEVEAGTGADTVVTGERSGDDVVRGDEGADIIDTGSGVDLVRGGAGQDVIRLGANGDVGRGGDGRDRLRGQGGRDALYGNARPDTIHGGAGTDECFGGDGRDGFESCETKEQ